MSIQKESSETESILTEFFDELRSRQRGLLLLDYDGTLAPFRDNRFEAVPAPGIRERINRIIADGKTTVVFVSGRPCSEVLTLAALDHPVAVWGCHGREYCTPEGEMQIVGVSPEEQAILRENRAKLLHLIPEEKLEIKTGCLAFHWRGIDEAKRKAIVAEFEEEWHRLAEKTGLKVLYFDGGIELAVPGRTKGDAVNQLLKEESARNAMVAFLGDDLTDEDGFRALGRRGISVLVRNEPRETVADVRIDMPEGVLGFLNRWHQALGKGG